MTVPNQQYPPNNKTSAFSPLGDGFAAPTRENDERNNRPNDRKERLHSEDSGGLGGVRPSPRIRGSVGDEAWRDLHISDVEGGRQTPTGSKGIGSDWHAGRVSSATEDVIAAIKRERELNCGCSSSTGICGFITRGFGKLDFNGYWQYPCPHGNDGAVHEDSYKAKESAILDNSQNKPKYSPAVTYLIGAVILVCMGLGVYLEVCFGW